MKFTKAWLLQRKTWLSIILNNYHFKREVLGYHNVRTEIIGKGPARWTRTIQNIYEVCESMTIAAENLVKHNR